MNSLRGMTWVLVLLFVLLYTFAICLVEVAGGMDAGYVDYSSDDAYIEEKMVQNFNNYQYFGTVTRAMMTLFNMLIVSTDALEGCHEGTIAESSPSPSARS